MCFDVTPPRPPVSPLALSQTRARAWASVSSSGMGSWQCAPHREPEKQTSDCVFRGACDAVSSQLLTFCRRRCPRHVVLGLEHPAVDAHLRGRASIQREKSPPSSHRVVGLSFAKYFFVPFALLGVLSHSFCHQTRISHLTIQSCFTE